MNERTEAPTSPTAHLPATPAAAVQPLDEDNRPNASKVLALLHALPKDAYAFLTAPNARDYLTILYVLYWNTRWRNPELLHDELFAQSNVIIRALSDTPLTDADFNRLMPQLADWGLVGRQVAVAPNYREWRIDWHQYWLKDDAYNLILSLEEMDARKRRRPSWTKGRDHIRGLADALAQIAGKLADIRDNSDDTARELRRQAYSDLMQLHDRDFAEFKSFLSDINKELLDLGRTPTVDFARIQLLIDRLEAFVQQTLRFFQTRGEEILQTVQQLNTDHLAGLLEGHQSERAAYEELARVPATDDTHPSPAAHLRDLRQYFATDGGLDAQSRRIQLSASLTTQRLRDYYNALTQRGRVRELLDRRIQEFMQTPVADANAALWLLGVFPVIQGQFAPGIGTTERRGTPQLPGRRYPYRRHQISDTDPETSRQGLDSIRDALLQRAQVINEFVETRILVGRSQASFRDAKIRDLQDFRHLLNAVRHEPSIAGTPLARFFTFTINDPRGTPLDPLDTVVWVGTDSARYTGPDLSVRRKPANAVLEMPEAIQ